MKKKEVIIIGDHVHFEDGHIKLISNKDKLFTRIEHKASIKYLNNIKDKIFKNSFFRLTFEGNRLVENLNSFRFLSKIEKAKEIYFFKTNKKILRPNKSKGITSKHLDIKINKDEYISYLTTLHCKDTAIITISENINGVFSDSILFQIKTVSDETIFLWETVNESSKATYTFISNNEFHKEVLNRIQSFLESKNIQSKRSCIKENTNLQTWLSFIKTIHHTEISIYKAEIENLLTTSRFIKQNFEYQSTQDYSNVNKILLESVFVDSFLKFKQNIYLIDGGLNLKKEITIRNYKGLRQSIISIRVLDLFDEELHSTAALYLRKDIIKNDLPYAYSSKYNFNDFTNKWANIEQYQYIGFKLYEVEGDKIIIKQIIINQYTFQKLYIKNIYDLTN